MPRANDRTNRLIPKDLGVFLSSTKGQSLYLMSKKCAMRGRSEMAL